LERRRRKQCPRWKKTYGSSGVPEVRELRHMREENARLKRLVADLRLDKQSGVKEPDLQPTEDGSALF
jgi:hypothetical protein